MVLSSENVKAPHYSENEVEHLVISISVSQLNEADVLWGDASVLSDEVRHMCWVSLFCSQLLLIGLSCLLKSYVTAVVRFLLLQKVLLFRLLWFASIRFLALLLSTLQNILVLLLWPRRLVKIVFFYDLRIQRWVASHLYSINLIIDFLISVRNA